MLVTVVLIHLTATIFMAGVIWFVQIVHYPLMQHVSSATYRRYQLLHVRRTTAIVAPAMLAEAASAAALVYLLDDPYLLTLAWVGIALLLVNWGSTAALQVPCHGRLEQGFDSATHRRLVLTNWVRTIGWSARSFIALAIVHRLLVAA